MLFFLVFMKIDLSFLPKEFKERVRKIVPPEKQERVFSSFFKERPTTLRVNSLKIDEDRLALVFKEEGLSVQKYRSIPGAFILIGNSQLKHLTSLQSYREGYFYVQSLSSMLPPLALDPRPKESILDMAAAPGSKTTQMAAVMENAGSITALDSNQARIYKLLANLKTQGIENTTVTRTDARFFWRKHSEEFDRVLLDAPCTGDGRFSSKDKDSFADWSLEEIERKRFLQRSLIFSAVNCLRPGGVLVYSTCTLSPEENEGIIDFALEKFKDRLRVEELPLHLPNFCPPVVRFGDRSFHPMIKRAVRIYPDERFEGFFICRLRKVG